MDERQPPTPSSALQQDLDSERALLAESVRRQRILSDVSRILLDYTGDDELEPLRRVVAKVVEALGDWCAFTLIQPDGLLKNVVQFHPEARQRELAIRAEVLVPPQRWDHGPPEANALLLRRPVYYEQVTDEMLRAGLPSDEAYQLYKEIGLTSLITAPLMAGGEPLGTMVLASTGAGGRRYSESDVDFVFSLAGRAALAVRNARLVSALNHERREAERRAAELVSVMQADPNGLALFGPDDRLRWANPSLDRLLGFPLSGKAGRHFTELPSEPDLPRESNGSAVEKLHVSEIFADRSRSARDAIRLGNPLRDLIRSSSPVHTPSGDYLGRLFVYVDVTAERELDRERADFLTIAAHEMRTPLTPLSMYLQTIERRLGRGQPIDSDVLGKARRQVRRLEKLVQDLLDVSRVDSGRVELRQDAVCLDELVEEVLGDFRGSASHHQLTFARPAGRVEVRGDRERLEQVIVNLVQNAIKYSPHGGRIRVSVGREGPDAVVSVSDDGIGIPPEEQQRLFQRFFRANNAATSNYGGLGIGLYVSHEIVQRHGGSFEVDSEPGRGTTFRFRVPAMTVAETEPPERKRILLVDDDADILEATSGFLRDEGFAVEVARDGRAALALVRSSAPHLMVIDLMMPVLDGWAFVEQLRAEGLAPGVPLVVFSADRDVRQKAASLKAQHVLRKPFSLDELHEVVERLIG